MNATLVILAGGDVGETASRLAHQQAAFDRRHRHIVRRGDAAFPGEYLVERCGNDAAAVALDAAGTPVVVLDAQQAASAAWIEDAFFRATRPRRVD